MYEKKEVLEFFSNDHVFEDKDSVTVILPVKGMSEVPSINDQFKVGPFLLKCIYATEKFVAGYIFTHTTAPTL